MKRIYFVTEGPTDQIVLQGLIEQWLNEDFIPIHIQPPSSAYAADLDSKLSEGWRGVLAWCSGEQEAARNEALRQADCLIIHTDADVAKDADFSSPAFIGSCPPASSAANRVRDRLIMAMSDATAPNIVLAVPAQDLEAWVLTALHPDIADNHKPIECRIEPGALLVQRTPHRLVRRKEGRLKKSKIKYQHAMPKIIDGWRNCTTGSEPRCLEALRFEEEVRQVLNGD
jgi:hypothetical protein